MMFFFAILRHFFLFFFFFCFFFSLKKEEPPELDTRHLISQWMCRQHNKVNFILNKPQFDCSKVDLRWRKQNFKTEKKMTRKF